MENYELGGSGPKKKRGRPRKADTVLLPEISALGLMTPASETKSRKPRVSHSDASPSGDGNPSLVGQPVHGVVDGSFDAGYLVTVRVGDSDTVYRGVVFGPGLSIPLSRDNDVAPKVKNTGRDDGVPLSSPVSSSPTAAPAASAEIPKGMPAFTVTPGVAGFGSAPSAFRSSFEQDMLSPGGFMYPGASQLHSGQGFVPRGYGYPFHVPGAEYGSGNAQFGADGQSAPPRGS